MVLAILLAGLLVIGAASAADNGAVDIVSTDDTTNFDGSLDESQEDNVEISTSNEDSNKLSTANDDLLGETVYVCNSVEDIENAISNTDADVIYLNGSTYTEKKDIYINRPVTIDGNGSIMEGVFFLIYANNITMKNITFERYTEDGCFGGGGTNISIINCHFENNYARCNGHSKGGAITLINENLLNYNQIINCTFDKNYIIAMGIDNVNLYTGAGALYLEGPTRIINCSFNNNYFRSSSHLDETDYYYFQGTAILSCDNTQIINCTFNGNNPGNMVHGRTVFLKNFNSKIINCSFVNRHGADISYEDGPIFENGYYAYVGPEGVFYEFVPTNLAISVSNVTYGEYPVVRLTTDVPGNYSLTVAGKDYGIYELNGELQITVNELLNASNGYVACVKLVNAPEYYDSSIVSTTFNVNQAFQNINVTFTEDFVMDYKDGSAWNITLLDASGNPISDATVKVSIAGKVYNRITDAYGVAGLPINLAPGVYGINATYEGTGEYESVFVNGTVTVNRAAATLTAENITLAYKNGSWIVTLTGAEGVIPKAGIKFGILGKVYTLKTNDNGVASLAINLVPGTYSVNATFEGNYKHESAFVEATVTVEKATTTIASEDLALCYKDGSAYAVTVTDANGIAVAGTTVKFSFGTKSYSIKTDTNGVAALPINLNVGEYTVKAVVDDARYTCEEATNTITVTEYDAVLVAGNINMTYQDGTNYEVQLTTADGTPIAIANLVVKITLLGKTYSIKTDTEGIAKLPINLKAGTYEITAEYNGSQVNSTVVVNKA